MKYILKKTGIIVVLLSILAINACKDNISPIYDKLEYDRIFAPLNISAEITNQTRVTLNWNVAPDVESYTLEISEDSLQFADIIKTVTVAANELPYVYDLPAGNTQYSARVKGVSSSEGVNDSKWTNVTFKSLPENLMDGYTIKMTALGTIIVKWQPGKAVTSLLFVSGAGEVSKEISADELAAGEKTVAGLANAEYEIRLINEDAIRGRQNYVLEGDVLLSAGGDITAAITAASAGDVIILAAGESFGFIGDMYIDKSIKIRGIDKDNLSVVYVNSADPANARMFIMDAALTSADSLVFENLLMSGYNNYDELGTKIRGVFDQETGWPCDLGLIKFKSCEIKNFGRHIVRLRGSATQTIQKIEIDDCILNDFAFGSNYALINSNNAAATINNIKITNTTAYHFRASFILYTKGPSCQSIDIENCTLNEITTDTISSRFIMDLDQTVFTGNGVSIKNCIFGSTSPKGLTKGVRTDASLTITNSFYTIDYDDLTGNSIKSQMTEFSGTSTDLWGDPLNGMFTFKGVLGASAGDPRWE